MGEDAVGRIAGQPDDDRSHESARAEPVERARRAYTRRAWREAHDQFAAADALAPLAPDDLERYARTAVHEPPNAAATWR